MWNPSTIAIDRRELTRPRPLHEAESRACCLVIYSGDEAGRAHTLEPGVNLLGRSVEVQVLLDHPGISRRHAEVVVDGAQVLLRDLASANGTYVNDEQVTAPILLNDGDVVRLGSVSLKFYRQRSLDAALHDRLYRMAMVDAGTGVFNRRYLLDALKRAVTQARQAAAPLCLVALDLDRFKSVNDRFGHAAGDQVLLGSATAMKDVLPPQAVLARLGGEEFGVLLLGSPLEAARTVAERLREAVAQQLYMLTPTGGGAPEGHQQTASLGVAELLATMSEPAQLLAAADQLLYQAKQAGRNRVAG